jgi:hypothetical protein
MFVSATEFAMFIRRAPDLCSSPERLQRLLIGAPVLPCQHIQRRAKPTLALLVLCSSDNKNRNRCGSDTFILCSKQYVGRIEVIKESMCCAVCVLAECTVALLLVAMCALLALALRMLCWTVRAREMQRG